MLMSLLLCFGHIRFGVTLEYAAHPKGPVQSLPPGIFDGWPSWIDEELPGA
jgi:hypothetical protein